MDLIFFPQIFVVPYLAFFILLHPPAHTPQPPRTCSHVHVPIRTHSHVSTPLPSRYEGSKPWKPYGEIDFTIWGGNDPGAPGCTSCPGYDSAVRYPVQVELKNFTKLSSASYVILYASLDWKTWWQASVPSILTVVNDPCDSTDDPELKTSQPFPCGMPGARNQTDGQKMDLCKIPNQLTDGPTLKPTNPPTKAPSASPARRLSLGDMLAPAAAPVVTGYNYLKSSLRGEAPIPGYVAEEDQEDYLANRRLTEEERKDSRALSADDGVADDLIEEYELDCCIGKPGPTYLVACVIRDWVSFNENGVKQPGPPFDDRCVAVSGVCGGTCGAHTKQPTHCEGGQIPLWELVSNLCDDPDTDDDYESIPKKDVDLGKKKKTKKWKEKHCGEEGNDDDTSHYWFDVPLIGHCYWSEVEPAWHWSFMVMMFMSWVSICTASLPGVGVCGSANARLPILHTLNQNHCIDTGVKCIGFSISASEHKLWVLRNLLGKLSASFLHENAVLVDYMQDETCRAGCYAMWDALARFMHVPVGNLEDTIGFCKAWAARLRDPSEILRETEDSFNKHSNKGLKVGRKSDYKTPFSTRFEALVGMFGERALWGEREGRHNCGGGGGGPLNHRPPTARTPYYRTKPLHGRSHPAHPAHPAHARSRFPRLSVLSMRSRTST